VWFALCDCVKSPVFAKDVWLDGPPQTCLLRHLNTPLHKLNKYHNPTRETGNRPEAQDPNFCVATLLLFPPALMPDLCIRSAMFPKALKL